MFNVFPPKLTYSSFLFVTPKNFRNFAYLQVWRNNRNFCLKTSLPSDVIKSWNMPL